MKIRLTRFDALTLAVLAVGMTLRAEESAALKKKEAVHAPRVQAVPKTVSPQTVSSSALSEVLATNLTLAPGTSQQVFAKTDFTGADNVSIGFFSTNDQDFSKTSYIIWWAPTGAMSYVAVNVLLGSNFAFLNSGGAQVATFGNQLMIQFQNNGTQPVTYSQVTLWANAR